MIHWILQDITRLIGILILNQKIRDILWYQMDIIYVYIIVYIDVREI